MNLQNLQIKYNNLLLRQKKAENFINNATEKQLKIWIPAYQDIVKELGILVLEYKDLTGKDMTSKEILEGFSA